MSHLILEVKDMSRANVIKAIKHNLEVRSGKTWSVTGGKGTAYGWLRISAPPRRCTVHTQLKAGHLNRLPEDWEGVDTGVTGGYMTPADCAELGQLLGMDHPAHMQYESVASSHDHYREYIQRSAGRKPTVYGHQYWD